MTSSSRRDFLLLGTLAGASLVLGCRRAGKTADGSAHRLNFWLAVHPDGALELRTTKLEMGQGIWTALAVMAAEELDVEPSALRLTVPSTEDVRRAPAGERIERRDKLLETTSSVSVARSWLPVRTAAAAAREMLIAAAAAGWGVQATECSAADGRVLHAASGRSAGYGELAAAAARLPVPRAPKLKTPSEFRFIGRATPRLDAREIATGLCRYSSDVRLPGQRFAVLARPPAIGGRALAVDDAAARAAAGVLDVLHLGERGVAVVGETTWAALAGREQLKISWDEGTAPELSSASFSKALEQALETPIPVEGEPYDPRSTSSVAVLVTRRGRALQWDERGIDVAEYSTAFQAHAPMEPPNAVVRCHADGGIEVWCGTQYPHRTQDLLARRFQRRPTQIVIHPQRMGGSFGRKESDDFVAETVEIALRSPGVPVQLFWSRSDDLRHDLFHPATRHRLAARLAAGRIVAWRHRLAAPSAEKQWKIMTNIQRIPKAESAGAWNLPYEAENLVVEYADPPCPIRLGFWRGVEAGSNAFAVESFVDELAHRAGRDPIEFRLAHLGSQVVSPRGDAPFPVSRLAACFELAARRADWSQPLPKGRGRGIAGVVFGGQTACASVAEVTVDGRAFRVDRIVCAIDCGLVVNPLGLAGNAESAIVWAMSSLGAEITFERGAAVETNYLDYPIPRLPEMPAVDVAIVPSTAPPSGSGEIPVPTIAPAVANAIFRASGRRLRRLPFRPEDLG